MTPKQREYAEIVSLSLQKAYSDEAIAEFFDSKVAAFCQKYTSYQPGEEYLLIYNMGKSNNSKKD